MTEQQQSATAAAPDSLVGLLPVSWSADEVDLLCEVHPQVWGEPLERVDDLIFEVGPSKARVVLTIDEAIPELVGMSEAAKHPFSATELLQLQDHKAIWRATMHDISSEPLEKSRAFARFIITAGEAGAPGVFFPFCVQLLPTQLLRHLSVEMNQPSTLTNLYISAFNDDKWMVTRGLTVFGLPELETPIDDGLNAAYFRLLDVATGMITQQDTYPTGARLQVGPHFFTLEPGPLGPPDKTVPFCGAFGRLVLRREPGR